MIAAPDWTGLSLFTTSMTATVVLLWKTFRTDRKLDVAHELAKNTNEAVDGKAPGAPTIGERVEQIAAVQSGATVPDSNGGVLLEATPQGVAQGVKKLLEKQAETAAAIAELRVLLKNGNGQPH